MRIAETEGIHFFLTMLAGDMISRKNQQLNCEACKNSNWSSLWNLSTAL